MKETRPAPEILAEQQARDLVILQKKLEVQKAYKNTNNRTLRNGILIMAVGGCQFVLATLVFNLNFSNATDIMREEYAKHPYLPESGLRRFPQDTYITQHLSPEKYKECRSAYGAYLAADAFSLAGLGVAAVGFVKVGAALLKSIGLTSEIRALNKEIGIKSKIAPSVAVKKIKCQSENPDAGNETNNTQLAALEKIRKDLESENRRGDLGDSMFVAGIWIALLGNAFKQTALFDGLHRSQRYAFRLYQTKEERIQYLTHNITADDRWHTPPGAPAFIKQTMDRGVTSAQDTIFAGIALAATGLFLSCCSRRKKYKTEADLKALELDYIEQTTRPSLLNRVSSGITSGIASAFGRFFGAAPQAPSHNDDGEGYTGESLKKQQAERQADLDRKAELRKLAKQLPPKDKEEMDAPNTQTSATDPKGKEEANAPATFKVRGQEIGLDKTLVSQQKGYRLYLDQESKSFTLLEKPVSGAFKETLATAATKKFIDKQGEKGLKKLVVTAQTKINEAELFELKLQGHHGKMRLYGIDVPITGLPNEKVIVLSYADKTTEGKKKNGVVDNIYKKTYASVVEAKHAARVSGEREEKKEAAVSGMVAVL